MNTTQENTKKPEGNEQIGRPSFRCEGNVKMDKKKKELGRGCGPDLSSSAKDREE
jgi:hypothetical protein